MCASTLILRVDANIVRFNSLAGVRALVWKGGGAHRIRRFGQTRATSVASGVGDLLAPLAAKQVGAWGC